MTGSPLKPAPAPTVPTAGKPDFASIEITNPELNPRFTLGLIRDVKIGPSPEIVRRRLKMAGVRAINNIVDATNYVMILRIFRLLSSQNGLNDDSALLPPVSVMITSKVLLLFYSYFTHFATHSCSNSSKPTFSPWIVY